MAVQVEVLVGVPLPYHVIVGGHFQESVTEDGLDVAEAGIGDAALLGRWDRHLRPGKRVAVGEPFADAAGEIAIR